MFSLKFCTAMERPAPIRLWPRCCSRAFIGTTKKPASAPMPTISGMAMRTSRTKIMQMTITPMAMPSGMTFTARASDTRTDAYTAPSAMPSATTPCSIEARDRL